MLRKFTAVLALNVYMLILMTAFQDAGVPLFNDSDAMFPSVSRIPDVRILGWQGHYIVMFCSSVAAIGLASFLAGAIAKDRPAITALIGSIPALLVMCLSAYIFGKSLEFDNHLGMLIGSVASLITIPLIARKMGIEGAETQLKFEWADKKAGQAENVHQQSENILGIWKWHWLWLIVPLKLYAAPLIFSLGREFQAIREAPISLNLQTLIPFLLWVAPLWLTYKILSKSLLKNTGKPVRAVTVSVVLILGFLLATFIQARFH
jgi:hypothetical protein